MKKKEDISKLDKESWAEYLKNPKDIFDKELEDRKPSNRLERYRFDLHGFTLLEANEKIRELINSCQKKGFKEILSTFIDKKFKGNVDFKKIIESSAFCSEKNEIISDNYKILKEQKIGIIPPIGGG